MTAGETTPIPTFPLRGKESSFLRAAKHSLPLRGRARVGVVRLLRLVLLGALRGKILKKGGTIRTRKIGFLVPGQEIN
jgi:hypothetical protein